MSHKILNIATFGLAGALFGGNGKKSAAPTATAPTKGPIITPLGDGGGLPANVRARLLAPPSAAGAMTAPSILSNKLGG